MPHQLQCLVHLTVGDQDDKGRLLKLYRESLLQCVIKHAVTGGVREITKDHGVSLGERGRFARTPPVDAACGQNDKGHRHGTQDPKFLSEASRGRDYGAVLPRFGFFYGHFLNRTAVHDHIAVAFRDLRHLLREAVPLPGTVTM